MLCGTEEYHTKHSFTYVATLDVLYVQQVQQGGADHKSGDGVYPLCSP